MKEINYYLSSLDSSILEVPRICQFKRIVHFQTGKEAIVAFIDPPIQYQQDGRFRVIEEIVVTSRHEGFELTSIDSFPCFVYVGFSNKNALTDSIGITPDQITIIGIAELYRTKYDAENHIFDNTSKS